MKNPFLQALLVLAAVLFYPALSLATPLDDIGAAALRAVTTNVNGQGIRVVQAEASLTTDLLTWEVKPSNVGQPIALFSYISADGATNSFPNLLGTESWHAIDVANNFYGYNGLATNVAQVVEIEADYFITNYVSNLLPIPPAPVVNQSFTFGNETTNLPTPANYLSVADQREIDAAYDDYAVQFNTLFISAANNGGPVSPPGTAYNSIGVGAYGAGSSSSFGPTLDNGRSKPDITAPAGHTSFSTPLVAGAATVLMQAALRGDGGTDTNAAFDQRTIKALLLNGAVKPADWTNSPAKPLDAHYGAGVVNILNAYEQLAGGKQNPCATNLVSINQPHPPVAITNTILMTSGWSFQTLASSATHAAVDHYFFQVADGMATVTLTWHRQFGVSNLNDLDLFLFNAANSNLVVCSTSHVDNIEHIFVPHLAAGRYDLQVFKNGGTNIVSAAETYALAWEFITPTLSLTKSGTNTFLTWPVYPAGFLIEGRTNLIYGSWQTDPLLSPNFTNGQNSIRVGMTNVLQFFRLRRPNI